MFELFLKRIMHHESREIISPEDSVYLRNLRLILPATLVVFGISIYWLLADRFMTSYNLAPIAKIAVWVQCGAAALMCGYSFLKKQYSQKLTRIFLLLFYIALIAGVSVLIASRNVDIQASGDNSSYIGVSTGAFYLLMLSFMPLPKRIDNTFILALMFIGVVAPELIIPSVPYSLMSHFLLCSCSAISAIFFRRILLQGAEHEREIRVLSEQQLENSLLDPMTRSMNRRAMDNYLRYLAEESDTDQIGVIFFDIDYFKKYNDYYGHVEGDRALQRISRISEDCFLELGNAFFFRYGGEEFIAILEKADEESLSEAMLRLRDRIYEAAVLREDIPAFDRITVTVGGALEKMPNDSGDYVLAADNQLYVGKNDFRNSVYMNNCRIGEETVPREIQYRDVESGNKELTLEREVL